MPARATSPVPGAVRRTVADIRVVDSAWIHHTSRRSRPVWSLLPQVGLKLAYALFARSCRAAFRGAVKTAARMA